MGAIIPLVQGEIVRQEETPDRITGLIAAWLHLVGQKSRRTQEAYRDYLSAFRSAIQAQGWDLLLPSRPPGPETTDTERTKYLGTWMLASDAIALAAQAWAASPNRRNGRPVAKSTHNLRLAAVASFYTYAIRHHECLAPSPVDATIVERLTRPMYAGVEPLPFADGEIDQQLAAIPHDLGGLRDRALLAIALYTGRRLSEIAGLRYGEIEIAASQIVIHWPRLKGDKTGKNIIRRAGGPAYAALVTWLAAFFPNVPTPETIVLPSLSRNHYGKQMTPQAVEGIAKRWMGTTRFHRLRHTFSAAYLASGGTIQELSSALSHSNLGITSVYAHALTDGENAHQEAMAEVFAGNGKKKSQ